ncbi:PAS domain-containing sensor histidine kinase [Bosea sp. WAO]|uniref:PAS domain-containing sensor histidine kinase n=1 Tax=Bosea sp. WAO TaxID=406341 RepID=UPI0008299FE9|nr:PAS domain-containing sensor histidine kinase [Bosea sp. WAO]
MSGSEQDWTALGSAVTLDGGMAPFVAGGALLLWSLDGQQLLHANSAGKALLARGPASLPAAVQARLRLLGSGLASPDTLRLERLGLGTGLSGMVTCACKLIESPAGLTLALGITGAELRRIGISIPAEAPPTAAIAPASAQAEATAENAAGEAPAPAVPGRRANLRFLWASDAEGRFTSASPEFAELASAEAAAALPGRTWSQLLGREILDLDGDLAERLATSNTWSGRAVMWRVAPGEGARVELSGFPLFDKERAPAGFRGFGLVRQSENEPFPEPEAIVESATPIAEVAPVDTHTSTDEAEPQPLAPDADLAVPTAEPATADAGEGATDAAITEASEPVATSERDAAEASESELDAGAEASTTNDAPAAAEADEESVRDETSQGTVSPATAAVDEEVSEPTASEAAANTETADKPPIPGNVVPLRNGQLTGVRPVLEPSKTLLSSAERSAFREIAKALGARIAGDDEETGLRLPAAAPLKVGEENKAEAQADAQSEAQPAPAAIEGRQRVANAHAEILDRLPIAVLVNRDETALYANRTLLDLLDYADLDDLTAAGGVSRLIKGATRSAGGAMILVDRKGGLVSVDGRLSSIGWQGEPATLMAFRNSVPGGDLKLLSEEEAEQHELAAEFEAEEEEAAARVASLRLEGSANESRVAELSAVLDTATDGVVTVDGRGRILSLNKSAEALFGYDQREVAGELFTLLFAPESHSPALDYLDGLIGGGVASLMNDGREVVGRVRQGGRIPLFMTMGRIAEGPDSKFCAVLRDITAWKKTESELVEARKTAEKASAQKSDVLAKISHEIRTPLNAIIGFAEVMAEERFGPIENERYKEYLRDIHQSGGYVISLVNDLLDLAKIEAGKLDLDFVSVSLNDIALSAVNLLQPEAQRGRVVLRSGLAPKLPPVVADERSLRQIVLNLLSNAVKFTDAGGQVIVSTALGDQGEAILRVRDTGIGMDDEEIALALEPFRRVPTTRKAGGTGLGLPLTKALVEANRAALTITSVKKEGTLVEVTFPPQRVLAG